MKANLFFVVRSNSIIACVDNYAEGDRLRKANEGSVLVYNQWGTGVPASVQRCKNWKKDGYAERFAAIA